jgi:Secretion system C-terminal sorting domain
MNSVDNRLIPFTDYQRQMITNGMNLTSYLESLRYQRLQALSYSRQLLVNIKDLIVEDSTITDKKTELLNLYADEWLPSDLMLKMNLYASASDIGSAESLIDLWPMYYDASTEELQASHHYIWLLSNSELLSDIEQSLSAVQIQQLEQISHSVLPEVAEWSKSILTARGLMEEEQLLDIPPRLSLRTASHSVFNMKKELYSLFPNPASDFATITCTDDIYTARTVTITDMTGRVVYQTVWKAGQKQLNIITNEFNSGVYLVQISGNSPIELMFVKQ